MTQDGAIGIFDSGIGGLTVARAIARALPGERLIYLGDTARLPYGSKSSETVVRYALRNVRFLRHPIEGRGGRLQHRLLRRAPRDP